MHSTDVRGTSSLYLGISHKKGFSSRGDRPGRSLESAESEREYLLGYDAAESLSYCVNMQTRERIAGFRMWNVELVEFSRSSLISCRTRQRVLYFMVPKTIKIESRFHAAVRRERDAIFLWHRRSPLDRGSCAKKHNCSLHHPLHRQQELSYSQWHCGDYCSQRHAFTLVNGRNVDRNDSCKTSWELQRRCRTDFSAGALDLSRALSQTRLLPSGVGFCTERRRVDDLQGRCCQQWYAQCA